MAFHSGCLVCRRKTMPGLLCCKRHKNRTFKITEVRLPVVYEPKAIYVDEVSTASMKLTYGSEIKT